MVASVRVAANNPGIPSSSAIASAAAVAAAAAAVSPSRWYLGNYRGISDRQLDGILEIIVVRQGWVSARGARPRGMSGRGQSLALDGRDDTGRGVGDDAARGVGDPADLGGGLAVAAVLGHYWAAGLGRETGPLD